MESNSVCNHKSDNKIGRTRSGSPICSLTYEYDYRPNWTRRSLITTKNKYYNFREKKNSQVMKERTSMFPSMFPSASPRGTLRVSGKQNSLFPLWPVIKCLFFVSLAFRDGDFLLSYWHYKHRTVQNLKRRREILFCGHVVNGRRHTGEFCRIR